MLRLHSFPTWVLAALLAAGLTTSPAAEPAPAPFQIITLDPGHFHAALFQKEMLPGVADLVHVYAPVGPDLVGHLNRVTQFNIRPVEPTRWRLEVHAGPDYFERLLAEKPGNIVVLSGRNRPKIGRIEALVQNRLHVLADKPWILEAAALPQLEAALHTASSNGVVAFDAMTERFEITCLLHRDLIHAPDIFGAIQPGSPQAPAVTMESLHYLMKEVAGVPNLRPAWFFDIREQGEGLTDVGTHLVDRSFWMLFPEQAVDYRQEIRMLEARRWPTLLSLAQFQRVTGEKAFPASLNPSLTSGSLAYFCNNSVLYTVRGLHVRLDIRWDFEAAPGTRDTSKVVVHGSRARLEVRQGPAERYLPEVYVIPQQQSQTEALAEALRRKIASWQTLYPDVGLTRTADGFKLVIPDRYRVGHEAHFSLVGRKFLDYIRTPTSVPGWENPNMLAKYYVTTAGVELARVNSARNANQTNATKQNKKRSE